MSRSIKCCWHNEHSCLTKLDREFSIGILQRLFEMSNFFSDVLVESLYLIHIEICILEYTGVSSILCTSILCICHFSWQRLKLFMHTFLYIEHVHALSYQFSMYTTFTSLKSEHQEAFFDIQFFVFPTVNHRHLPDHQKAF